MKLFRRGYFSVPRPGFAPLNAEEARPVREALAAHYPGLRPRAIARVKAFGLNSGNWKFSSGGETFILKRAGLEKTALLKQAHWTQALSDSGFPTIKFILDARFTLVARDKKYQYCVSRYEGGAYLGKSMKRWGDLLKKEEELLRWCRSHPAKAGWPRREFLTEEEQFTAKRITRGWLSAEDSAYVRRKYAELLALQKRGLRRGVFHIDIHPLNVLFRGDKLVLLLDFDSFCLTTVEVSLGFSLFKCARELLVGLPPAAFRRRVRLMDRMVGDRFGRSFLELLSYARLDLMKRLIGVHSAGPSSSWAFMLETQLLGLKEADAMIAACAPGKLKSPQR